MEACQIPSTVHHKVLRAENTQCTTTTTTSTAMSRITCYIGLLLACSALVLSIPPPEASMPGMPPAVAGFMPAMGANPFMAKFKPGAPAAAPARVAPAAAAGAAPGATTTLPPAVNNLIAKYKAAAAAFYPTIPVV